MAEPKFVELVTAAHHYLRDRQESLERVFSLSRYERWDWDAESGTVVFSDGATPRVIAQAQVVGSVSKETGTWLWSWANSSIDQRHRKDLSEVQRFGEQQGIWQLTTAKWEADEVDGWEMTSIAAYVLQAKGAYRMPSERLFTFAVFDAVNWAPEGPAVR
jgi:hypothetical protein